MDSASILVLGGYGAFGTRLVRLLTASELVVHVAGRRREAAERACAALGTERVRPVVLDRDAVDAIVAFVRETRVRVVIDAVGPFQGRDHRLPEAVAAAGAHWIDLADAREYVGGIGRLHEHARSHGVLVASGASTVPALSVAVVDRLLDDLDALESISIGITPGHRGPRGLSTVRSVLSYCGKRIPAVAGGQATTTRGWGGLRRHRYPAPVGARWLSNVDLPDVDVLARRYPGLDSLQLQAGLELTPLHLGLSLLSAFVARGWIASLEPWAASMKRAADLLHAFGSTNGAMHVTVCGGRGGRRIARHWTLVAENDDGPFIPATAASVLAKRLCGVAGYAPLEARGAAPCVGLVSLDEFLRELAGRAIRVEQRDEVR